MSTPCYYGELDQDNCSFFIHGVDVQDAIQQAHRAGVEEGKKQTAQECLAYLEDWGNGVPHAVKDGFKKQFGLEG